MKVYLDNAATTKPYNDVIALMSEIQKSNYGNPSSAHSMGLEAEKAIKQAGDIISSTIKTDRDNLVFTSGGTEADNMAIMQPYSDISKIKDRGLIISSIEHPAVNAPSEYLEGCGAKLTTIPVDNAGMIDLDQLRKSIDPKTSLISIMLVNNEIGTIQPIKEICSIKKEAVSKSNRDLKLHTDAVQAYGKFPIDVTSKDYSSIDLMSISAHKIHGPKGTGALYVKSPNKLKPFIRGGGQQGGFRSGTENVAGIAGFGLAAEIQHANINDNMKKVELLRKRLLEGIMDTVPHIRINSPVETSAAGEPGKCIPNILSISFLGTRGEVILHSLEEKGIFVSTESACSSKKRGNSPVLSAIGLNLEEIEGTIRFSLSAFNTEDEIEYCIAETKNAVEKFRKMTGYKK